MTSIKFSLVIPNLNGAKLLSPCLKSLLFALKKVPHLKFEIILIDNASTDNSVSLFTLKTKKLINLLKIENCKLKILQNSRNLGVSPAIRQGIAAAQYPYVIPCNNDIKFHPQWFSHIVKAIQTNHDPLLITFFGTILNKTGDRIESTGFNFNYSGKCTHLNHNKKFRPNIKNSREVWGASAALVVYHTSTVKKIGSFDPDFFAYEEDVDLALRLHNLGYKTLWVPPALSYHLGGATSSKMGNFRYRHDAKNWIYVIIKNYSLRQIIQNFPGIVEQRLRNLSGLLKNTPFILWLPTLISVYGQVIIKLPAMLTKRRQIIKQSFF